MIDTKQLRCNVLDLALRGKLTHQNPEDDARDLLKRVNAKRNIEQNDNVPYTLPCNWAWVKIKDLFNINPKVDAEDEAKAAFIPMEKISAGFSEEFSYEEQIWKIASKNHTKFADGDVAFAKISPCFENRKSFVAKNLPNGIGGGTTELIVLRQPELFAEYIYLLIIDQRFIKSGSSSYKGIVGQQRIKPDSYKEYLVPIAPMEEQKRIVATVQAAFDILDQIDKLQQQYSSDLEVLKSKIIDAGIQGKLTEQLPEDGTADELLKQIAEEKDQLIKEKKIKASKVLPEISEDEIPFEIPTTWKWVRLSDLVSVLGDGLHGTPSYDEKGDYYFINGNNLMNGQILIKEDTKRINEDEWEKYKKPLDRTTVFVSINGTLGNVAFYNDEKVILGKSACYFNMIIEKMKYYLYWILKSNYFMKYAVYSATGVTIKNVSLKAMNNLLIPLPPLSEQKRIVEKIDEILSLI